MFGRATITLGTGPHSSCFVVVVMFVADFFVGVVVQNIRHSTLSTGVTVSDVYCMRYYYSAYVHHYTEELPAFQVDRRFLRKSWCGFYTQKINYNYCRSTGTLHTSVKARLTSFVIRIWIWIRIWIPDAERHQNLTVCSLAHCQPFLKISCKSVLKFFFAKSC